MPELTEAHIRILRHVQHREWPALQQQPIEELASVFKMNLAIVPGLSQIGYSPDEAAMSIASSVQVFNSLASRVELTDHGHALLEPGDPA